VKWYNQKNKKEIHQGRRRFLKGVIVSAATAALSGAYVIPKAYGSIDDASPRELFAPKGLKFSDDGFLYVADSGGYRIQVFNRDQKFIKKMGMPGTGSGELNYPCDLDIAEEKIYALDTNNGRVVVFDRNTGNHIKTFGSLGGGSGSLFTPTGLTIDGDNLYIANTRGHCVQVWNRKTGSILKVIGMFGDEKSKPSPGSKNIKLRLPAAVEVDNVAKRLFLADSGHGRVVYTDLNGGYIGEYDGRDTGLKLSRPEDLCIYGRELFIVDRGNKRIVRVDLETGNSRVLTGNWVLPVGIDIFENSLAISDDNQEMNKLNKFTVNLPG